MSDAQFTEFDAQLVELLPARTVLSSVTINVFGEGGDGWGGDGWGGDGGDVAVAYNENHGYDQVITATGGEGGPGFGGDGEGGDGIEIDDGPAEPEANGEDPNGGEGPEA